MAKPKLALIPSGYSEGKVYSILPSNGDGDFTTTRASKATRINKDGFIENVDSGIPRLDYPLIDGVVSGCPSLLLEPQSTNLITQSEAFDNAYWTKSGSSVTSGFISPTGGLDAFKLVEDTSTGSHICYKAIDGSSNTFSFYAKYSGNQYVAISYDGGNNFNFFDILNGQLGTQADTSRTSTITSVGNGWYRCSMYNGNNTFGATIWMSSDGIATSYTGDGTSGVYLFGAQLEQGSYPTSYIPTEGTVVTRLADTATGAGTADTFNDSEGVLMVELSTPDTSLVPVISLSDGSFSNAIEFAYFGTNQWNFISRVSGGAPAVTGTVNASDLSKFCVAYTTTNFKVYLNGFLVGSQILPSPLSGLDVLDFSLPNGNNDFYGKTKQLQYFNTALTDSELEELTSWSSFLEMAQALNYNII